MAQDYLGNTITTDNDTTRVAIDDFVGGFLGYESRAENIAAVADADPDAPLANAYAGFLWMFLEAPEAPSKARTYLEKAQRQADQAGRATRREQLNVAVLDAWVADDLPRVLRLCDQVSDEYPRDLVIAKLHQYLEFNRGNSPEMLRVSAKILPHNADVPHAHGLAAFAYEQCHLLDQAERAARRAIELQRKEPWAQHALAHVLLTRGQVEEGTAFLESVSDTWNGLNSFMYTHNWWHLAVFYLSRGDNRRVLDIYDRHVWGIAKDYSQDQIGAVQLLTRLELAGADVGNRWHDLAGHLAARQDDTVQPFLSLLYLYGLARAGRPEAEGLLEAIRRQAGAAPAHIRETWRDVALPVARGLAAYARGGYEDAVNHLAPAVPRLVVIGGSHAQRDLFEQVLLDAAHRSGRWLLAHQWLEGRRTGDPGNVPVNRALARLYTQLGLPAEAAEAAERVRRTLARAGHGGEAVPA